LRGVGLARGEGWEMVRAREDSRESGKGEELEGRDGAIVGVGRGVGVGEG
jgi:hypothetical protein